MRWQAQVDLREAAPQLNGLATVVTLRPGELLHVTPSNPILSPSRRCIVAGIPLVRARYVPSHWFHYVEALTPRSVSINMWSHSLGYAPPPNSLIRVSHLCISCRYRYDVWRVVANSDAPEQASHSVA
jgi:hypothetical protein